MVCYEIDINIPFFLGAVMTVDSIIHLMDGIVVREDSILTSILWYNKQSH